jgi:predicted transcriptional regulator
MTAVTRAEIKGLFAQLVSVVGGIEAAGAFLGVSHQRVSQLQNPTCADMPTVVQIVTLEEVIGQPIVTSALARAAIGGSITHDPDKEIGDVVIAQANVMSLRRAGAAAKEVKAAALRLVKEAEEVVDSIGGDAA